MIVIKIASYHHYHKKIYMQKGYDGNIPKAVSMLEEIKKRRDFSSYPANVALLWFHRQKMVEIDREEIRIKVVKEQNDKTKRTIDEFRRKSTAWETARDQTIEKINRQITKLMEVTIDDEIANHKKYDS